jgi:Protein of unknown function (DUF1571)
MARQTMGLRYSFAAGCAALALALGLTLSMRVGGQTQFTEPVYRVAAQDATQTAAQDGVRVAGAETVGSSVPPVQPAGAGQPAGSSPFDLTTQPGEHPLAPVIRVCKASLEHIDRNVKDYSCTLIKRERLPDEPAIGEPQYIDLRILHEPFSVHMSFRQPHAGRKVVWVQGQNENKLTVREAGLLSFAGRVDLAPESTTAMSGQKYPIYKIGIRNLLLELIKSFEADTKFTESEVKMDPRAEFNKRPATLIQVSHPIPRQNFRSHIARIYFDNELKMPIYYDAWMWPAKEGEQPPMEESFAYSNLKVNNGYTGRDFDRENAEIFK